jgi:hypothetical protein
MKFNIISGNEIEFLFNSTYNGRSSREMLGQKLELKPDGTFKCNYSIGAVKEYQWYFWEVAGKFYYNSKERKLILDADKMEFQTWSNWKEDKLNPVILECVDKTYKKQKFRISSGE